MVTVADLQTVAQQLQDAIATVNGEMVTMRMRADSIITDMQTQDQNLRQELAARTTASDQRIQDTENAITGMQTQYQGLSQIGTPQITMLQNMSRNLSATDDATMQNWIQGASATGANLNRLEMITNTALTNLDARINQMGLDQQQLHQTMTARIPVPGGAVTDSEFRGNGKPIMDSNCGMK